MDKNYLEELTLKIYNTAIIKEALIINIRSLKDRLEDWRENQYILVPVAELPVEWAK